MVNSYPTNPNTAAYIETQSMYHCEFFLKTSMDWPPLQADAAERPEIPEHPPITRRNQFQVKKNIKEERDAKKGKGKGKGSQKNVKKTGKKGKKNQKGKHISKKRQTLKKVKKDKLKAEVKSEKEKKSATKKKTKKTTPAEPAERVNVDTVAKPQELKNTTKKRKDLEPDTAAPLKKTKGASGPKATSSKVDLEVQKELMEILGTCPGEGCDHEHHHFRIPKYDDLQISIYWTRNAVGVKCRSSKLENSKSNAKNDSKPKKDPFKQVGYFAHGSCTCCNLFLACKWVSHQHQIFTLKTQRVHVVYMKIIRSQEFMFWFGLNKTSLPLS